MDPVRTCIGCRSRSPKSSLLRVVSRGSVVVVDDSASMDGRGAWVHPSAECVEKAITRRAFGRALRIAGTADVQNLQNRLNG
ncbi:YlxR family protein [Mycetocola reblochoni]|uniref:YlxR family protein n=1 Tax=Mycetocola reblochoni TaxID=331618 RepID=A0A3L6ZR82_9MICO|nr:YlxR family protein [Mycetocola reblochoni]RLP70367.1 YlxR family protein [Mycetocola reblochoni]